MLDLMQAPELEQQLGDEEAAQAASKPALALAYLRAADRVIQVDDFAP